MANMIQTRRDVQSQDTGKLLFAAYQNVLFIIRFGSSDGHLNQVISAVDQQRNSGYVFVLHQKQHAIRRLFYSTDTLGR